MRTFDVPYMDKIDWERVPKLRIDRHLWSDVRSIAPSAQIGWNGEGLHLRLQTREQDILRRFTGLYDMVCQDSCLEFFFCPEETGDRYFNFETNPNGALYVGFGRPGADRARLIRSNWNALFAVKPYDIPGGWGVELHIPVRFIQIFVPEFTLRPGMILRANFYKCGDDTAQPHYIAWNAVDHPTPNFHLPQYFGELHLK